MLEIEQKYRIEDFAWVEARLSEAGAGKGVLEREADLYYNAPDRDFKATDEVFRIRCIGDTAILTYKGPKQPGAVKIRREIEVPLASGEDNLKLARNLVSSLGYRFVAEVFKERRQWSLERGGYTIHVCRDSVADLGEFLELEIVAPEAETEKAQRLLMELEAEWKLTQREQRSYLYMTLEKLGKA